MATILFFLLVSFARAAEIPRPANIPDDSTLSFKIYDNNNLRVVNFHGNSSSHVIVKILLVNNLTSSSSSQGGLKLIYSDETCRLYRGKEVTIKTRHPHVTKRLFRFDTLNQTSLLTLFPAFIKANWRYKEISCWNDEAVSASLAMEAILKGQPQAAALQWGLLPPAEYNETILVQLIHTLDSQKVAFLDTFNLTNTFYQDTVVQKLDQITVGAIAFVAPYHFNGITDANLLTLKARRMNLEYTPGLTVSGIHAYILQAVTQNHPTNTYFGAPVVVNISSWFPGYRASYNSSTTFTYTPTRETHLAEKVTLHSSNTTNKGWLAKVAHYSYNLAGYSNYWHRFVVTFH